MNQELIRQLSVITEEEQEILAGRGIDKSRYTEGEGLIVDSRKMLDAGKLIQIRPHTRFVRFPRHRHNYIEVIYMCRGETSHLIDGRSIVLKEGELLFLNQNAQQEILPAGENDVAVNFIILPEFFDVAFKMLGEGENLLRDFLVGCLCESGRYDNYLHFHVADMLGFDVYWLSRMIKKLTGRNYKDLLQIKRLNQAAYLLLNTRASVADISVAVGYDNTSYFHRIFRSYYGLSPKEYRRANQKGG